MPLTFLLDEHLRGALRRAIQQHNAGGTDLIDAVWVGDPPDLPLGSTDADIITWAESAGRIVISRDERTMPGHLAHHLRAGNHSLGLLILKRGFSIPEIVAAMVLIAHAGDPADYFDQINYFP